MKKPTISNKNLQYNTPVEINKQIFQCALCKTDEECALGLMGQQVPDQCGAILDFRKPSHIVLNMKNCLQPLTAIFVQSNKVVYKMEMDNGDPKQTFECPVIATQVIELLPQDAQKIKKGDIVKISS